VYADAVDLKAHLEVDLKAMSNGPIEIIGGREQRRLGKSGQVR
jgi:hypothetical protein